MIGIKTLNGKCDELTKKILDAMKQLEQMNKTTDHTLKAQQTKINDLENRLKATEAMLQEIINN